MGYVVEDRKSDGSYRRWNLGLYMDYMRAKFESKERGCEHQQPVDHPVLNKVYDRFGDLIKFTKVVRHWHGGFYYLGVFEVNASGSHGTVVVGNINCIDPVITKQYEAFLTSFKEVV